MGRFQLGQLLLQLSQLRFQLGGVHGGHANGQHKLALGGLIIGGCGGGDLDGDGGADDHALVNGDLHTIHGVALAGQDGEAGSLQRVGDGGNVHHIAGHHLVQRCAHRDGGDRLLDLKVHRAGEVAAQGSSGGADHNVARIGDGAAELGGLEGNAAVYGGDQLGFVLLAGIEEFSIQIQELHGGGCGSDDQFVFNGGILMVGRAAYHHQHLVSACIGGSAQKRSAAVHIADGDILLLQAGRQGDSNFLGAKIEGGGQILHRKVSLGEGGLFNSEGFLYTARVVALAVNRNGVCADIDEVIIGINADSVIHVVLQHHTADRNGNVAAVGGLHIAVVNRAVYGDHRVGGKVRALLDGDVLYIIINIVANYRSGIDDLAVFAIEVVVLGKNFCQRVMIIL